MEGKWGAGGFSLDDREHVRYQLYWMWKQVAPEIAAALDEVGADGKIIMIGDKAVVWSPSTGKSVELDVKSPEIRQGDLRKAASTGKEDRATVSATVGGAFSAMQGFARRARIVAGSAGDVGRARQFGAVEVGTDLVGKGFFFVEGAVNTIDAVYLIGTGKATVEKMGYLGADTVVDGIAVFAFPEGVLAPLVYYPIKYTIGWGPILQVYATTPYMPGRPW